MTDDGRARYLYVLAWLYTRQAAMQIFAYALSSVFVSLSVSFENSRVRARFDRLPPF